MNGIEKIAARIEADAMAEIAAMEAEAEARCTEIKAEAKARAAEAYAQRIAKGQAYCAERRERLGAAADMEARKALLAFKQEMVGEAFDLAVEAMTKLPKDEYIDFLARLMSEAAMNGEEEALFSETDRANVGAETVKKANGLIKAKGGRATLSLSAETAEIPGGFILRSGNIEVNCAVDTLVHLHKSRLAGQVASILFG